MFVPLFFFLVCVCARAFLLHLIIIHAVFATSVTSRVPEATVRPVWSFVIRILFGHARPKITTLPGSSATRTLALSPWFTCSVNGLCANQHTHTHKSSSGLSAKKTVKCTPPLNLCVCVCLGRRRSAARTRIIEESTANMHGARFCSHSASGTVRA